MEEGAARTCLRPTRAYLTFQNRGTIPGMIVMDGLGNLRKRKDLWAGLRGSWRRRWWSFQLVTKGGYATQVSYAKVQDGNGGHSPLPPGSLSLLVQLSSSSTSKVLLMGSDDVFAVGSL